METVTSTLLVLYSFLLILPHPCSLHPSLSPSLLLLPAAPSLFLPLFLCLSLLPSPLPSVSLSFSVSLPVSLYLSVSFCLPFSLSLSVSLSLSLHYGEIQMSRNCCLWSVRNGDPLRVTVEPDPLIQSRQDRTTVPTDIVATALSETLSQVTELSHSQFPDPQKSQDNNCWLFEAKLYDACRILFLKI